MKIFVVNNKINEELEKLNNGRNEIYYTTLVNAIYRTLTSKGSIIYSEKENKFLNFLQSSIKIPYLFGKINNIIAFENHYARCKKKDIPVLMYHQFVNDPKEAGNIKIFVTAKSFELHLKILKFLGYQTITFEDLTKIGLQNRFYKKYIILTVDDGYKDNYQILFPLLKKYNMKAVIFLVSGLTYNKWTVDNYNEKHFDLMSVDEVLELQNSGLIEFGGHTLTHPSFHEISDELAKEEIFKDKELTENRLNKRLTTFAYPYGHNRDSSRKIVQEAGYVFGVSTDTGSGIITEDLFDIRRTAIDKTSLFDFLRKISPKYLQYKAKKYKRKS